MVEIITGSRVRFEATVRSRLKSKFRVSATVSLGGGEPTEVQDLRQDGEVYSFEMLVDRPGPMVVEFHAGNLARNRVEYAVIDPSSSVSTREPRRDLSSVPLEAQREDEVPSDDYPLDRVAARRRLMAAGIPFDDTWSDAKVSGALAGLDSNERDRRAHKF